MNWKRKALVILSILIAGWTLTAPPLANFLIVQKPLEKADAIVILSGSAEFIERAQEAAIIFRNGSSPRIFLTNDGIPGPWDNELLLNPTSVDRTRRELMKLAVPEGAIEILPSAVNGTHDEAIVVVRALAEKEIKSVILVTSAYHSRRALSTFERVLRREHFTLTVGVQSPSERAGAFWWLTAKGWTTVGLESVKTIYYLAFY